MHDKVDSFRFIDRATRQVVRSWIARETPRPIPWTPLTKPLSACRIALISSGGVALKTDKPFDQEGERRNPWWGDPSHRILPRQTKSEDIKIYHLHVDPYYGEQDLNCLLPLERLLDLEASGEIGDSAPSHYSFMGYILQPDKLLEETTPMMIRQLQAEEVDVVLLVPA